MNSAKAAAAAAGGDGDTAVAEMPKEPPGLAGTEGLTSNSCAGASAFGSGGGGDGGGKDDKPWEGV